MNTVRDKVIEIIKHARTNAHAFTDWSIDNGDKNAEYEADQILALIASIVPEKKRIATELALTVHEELTAGGHNDCVDLMNKGIGK